MDQAEILNTVISYVKFRSNLTFEKFSPALTAAAAAAA